MSRYAEKVAARRVAGTLAAIDLAVRISDGGEAPPPPAKRPRVPPPEPRGILVDLGAAPENAAPGNAASLREALEQALAYCESDQKSGIAYSDNDVLVPMLRAALAAPARNCDRFRSAVAAMEEWEKYPQSRYKGCRVCPHGDASMLSPSHLTLAEWLFAPAEGGDHD